MNKTLKKICELIEVHNELYYDVKMFTHPSSTIYDSFTVNNYVAALHQPVRHDQSEKEGRASLIKRGFVVIRTSFTADELERMYGAEAKAVVFPEYRTALIYDRYNIWAGSFLTKCSITCSSKNFITLGITEESVEYLSDYLSTSPSMLTIYIYDKEFSNACESISENHRLEVKPTKHRRERVYNVMGQCDKSLDFLFGDYTRLHCEYKRDVVIYDESDCIDFRLAEIDELPQVVLEEFKTMFSMLQLHKKLSFIEFEIDIKRLPLLYEMMGIE